MTVNAARVTALKEGAEQEGHSRVKPERRGEGGEERVERKGGDDTGQASLVEKLNTLSGSAKDYILQCQVYDLPIRQRPTCICLRLLPLI